MAITSIGDSNLGRRQLRDRFSEFLQKTPSNSAEAINNKTDPSTEQQPQDNSAEASNQQADQTNPQIVQTETPSMLVTADTLSNGSTDPCGCEEPSKYTEPGKIDLKPLPDWTFPTDCDIKKGEVVRFDCFVPKLDGTSVSGSLVVAERVDGAGYVADTVSSNGALYINTGAPLDEKSKIELIPDASGHIAGIRYPYHQHDTKVTGAILETSTGDIILTMEGNELAVRIHSGTPGYAEMRALFPQDGA